MASKNWFCVLYLTTELQLVIPLARAGVVRLGGDEVAACYQFVTLDGGIVMDRPPVFFEALGGVLDTNSKKILWEDLKTRVVPGKLLERKCSETERSLP